MTDDGSCRIDNDGFVFDASSADDVELASYAHHGDVKQKKKLLILFYVSIVCILRLLLILLGCCVESIIDIRTCRRCSQIR